MYVSNYDVLKINCTKLGWLTIKLLDRTKRVKEARDEAKKEIDNYRQEKEEEFKKYESEVCCGMTYRIRTTCTNLKRMGFEEADRFDYSTRVVIRKLKKTPTEMRNNRSRVSQRPGKVVKRRLWIIC